MPTRAQNEKKKARDAVNHARDIILSCSCLSVLQRKQVDVLIRMSYYLGLMDGMKEYYAVHESLQDGEEIAA